MLKDRDKFWAFIALLVLIAVITLPSLIRVVSQTQLSLADKVITGLVGVLGTVAGALFQAGRDRVEQTNADTQKILATTAAAIPTTVLASVTSAEPLAGSGTADKPVWEK